MHTSIPAVKGVEIGRGFESATLTGEENADEIFVKNKIHYISNNAGGTLGITSGQDIVVKFAVKPTSSILKKRKTIDVKTNQPHYYKRKTRSLCWDKSSSYR